jgi:type IV secretory pathway VirB10-like protein
VLALSMLGKSGDQAREAKVAATVPPATPATVPAATPAATPQADAAIAKVPVPPVAPPPQVLDAAVANDPAPQIAVAPPDKPAAKAPPSLPALQKSVERIGGQLNKIAATVDTKEIDALRRKWLDLATALPELGNEVDERREFSARVRRLKNAVKKASRSK